MNQYEYHTEIRPLGVGLTAEEIERKGKEGWEEYFPTPEERISFQVGNGVVLPGTSAGYIFRRVKKN